MRTRRTFFFFAAIVLLAGCGSPSTSATPEPTLTDGPTTTTTIIDVRSRDTPVHPDAAYINAVFVELERIRGDVRRLVYGTQSVSQSTNQRLEDIYGNDEVIRQKKVFASASMEAHPDALSGDVVLTVKDLLDTRGDCIVVTANSDISKVTKDASTTTPIVWIYQLVRFDGDNRSNPTPWKIVYSSSYDAAHLKDYTCGPV